MVEGHRLLGFRAGGTAHIFLAKGPRALRLVPVVKDSAAIRRPMPGPARKRSNTHQGRNKKHKAGCFSERRTPGGG